MPLQYEICNALPDGTYKIKFTENPFSGIMFTLGKVSFEEIGDECVMHYDYNVVEHKDTYVKEDLDRAVGDLVIHLLEEGIEQNSLIYTGGIDED